MAYSTQFVIRTKLEPRNMVMVATVMYVKSPYGSRYTELRESMNFLPFLFSFLIIIFITSVTFLLSTIVLLFGKIFVYDSDCYGTAATSGKELFMITIYGFQSLLFVIGRFVWDVLAIAIYQLVCCRNSLDH